MEEGAFDAEFDQALVNMKPNVLRLPRKSERQRCAQWIRKLCELQSHGIHEKQNRNLYAQLLVHMLKKGILEGPFACRPEMGSLPTLPAYMSIYLDDYKKNGTEALQSRVPDWVTGELASDVTGLSSMTHSDSVDAARFQAARERFSAAAGDQLSPPPHGARTTYFEEDHSSLPVSRHHTREVKAQRTADKLKADDLRFPKGQSSDEESADLSPQDFTRPKAGSATALYPNMPQGQHDWTNGTFSSTLPAAIGNSLFREETAMQHVQNRELEMRTKMLEAQFQEDKLKLQQKHDATVQKILDRKNVEIDELKTTYRTKAKEYEETITKQEKKVHQLQREISMVAEAKEQHVGDITKKLDEGSLKRQQELEKKLNEAVSGFEQEKFDLQKQHTKNIQELLDDTNTRLAKMEAEYCQQMDSTSALIRELENRVQHLATEAENLGRLRNQLEREKVDLEAKVDRMQGDLTSQQEKLLTQDKEMRRLKEDHETQLRSLRNKHDANVDFLRQEQSLAAVKAADTIAILEFHLSQIKDSYKTMERFQVSFLRASDRISDLEQCVSQLKQNLEAAETQRQNQLREMEQTQQQDKLHVEHLHEKKLRNLQREMDQQEQEYQKKIHKLENTVREKEEEGRHVAEQQKQLSAQSERALADFKAQVESNSNKMYDDMKIQMEKVESDLNRSKQLREKQAREFQKRLDEANNRHHEQVSTVRAQYELDRGRLLAEFQADKELRAAEKEQEVEMMVEKLRSEAEEAANRAKERQQKYEKALDENEQQLQALREELLQANQLRKQQLMELGLLREEEKQKLLREHEASISGLHSENEQRILDLEKKHSVEIEGLLDKTNTKLKDLEREYSDRSHKSIETIAELQHHLAEAKSEVQRTRESAEHERASSETRHEQERRKLKQQQGTSILSLQQEVENNKVKARHLDKRLKSQEQDFDEKITKLRSQYEERLRGLIPMSVRQELEATIGSLKSQVSSLQQRAALLQEAAERAGGGGTLYPGNGSVVLGGPLRGSNLSASLNTLGSASSVKSAS